MRRWIRWLAPAFVGAAAITLTLTAGTATAKREGRPVDRVVMFASDGMRPDLMEKYSKAGLMPTYSKLMKDGAVLAIEGSIGPRRHAMARSARSVVEVREGWGPRFVEAGLEAALRR